MFGPREGNAPSLTAKFTADCSICQLSVAVVSLPTLPFEPLEGVEPSNVRVETVFLSSFHSLHDV